jgi:hypothetical protein
MLWELLGEKFWSLDEGQALIRHAELTPALGANA